jgi:dipeptidyl aminopeptidase/acylaminoacyl peptidase
MLNEQNRMMMTPDQYLDALLALPALFGAQVSPDGRWVAWTWANAGPTYDVYAAPSDGSAAPIRLTQSAQDSVLVSWAPDSAAMIVGGDHDGDEHVQLFRVDLARPGAMQPLTESSPPYFLYGGDLHPNRRWLVYSMNYDVERGAPIEQNWVYRHDLHSGERVALARPARGGYSEPNLNRQGTHILYSRKDLHPAGTQVWLVDVEGREDREILNVGAEKQVWASWLPDGERALVLAEAGAHRRVGLWESATGSCRWLLDDPKRNVEKAYVPHGSTHAVIVDVRGARSHASLLDLETGMEIPLPEAPGDLIPLAPTPDGRWVGRYSSSRQPTDLVLFSVDDARPEAFLSLSRVWERTALRPHDLVQAQDRRWRSADGLEIQGWLYLARDRARGTIVHVHGGPTHHSADRLSAEIQYYVSHGFNVLDPNYRGSTGFGLAYQEAIKDDGWGGREQEDIRAGIEALIAEDIAQAGRVGITGTSYGGYSSWCAITRLPPETLAAAAPICGMTDLVIDYQTTRPDLRPYSEEMLGGTPAQVPERYRERSPIHFVGNIRGRLLIVQGMRDPNVTPENVRAVRAALDAAGIRYGVLAFEDEGHGIGRPANQRALYGRLADFFAEAFAAQ